MSVRTHLNILAKNKKVLIVDDDIQILEVLKDILGYSFKSVVVASDGEQALKLYQQDKFDLIITDIRMPKMDGIQLCYEVKKINEEQPIIVISAHNDSEYLMDLISIGISDFLVKPVDTNLFFKKIIKVLEYILHKKEIERLRFKQFAQALKNGGDSNKHIKAEEELKRQKSRHQLVMEDIINHEIIEEKQIKISAIECLDKIKKDKELWELLQSQMEEIILLGDDFEEYVNSMLLTGVDEASIEQVANILKKYHSIFYVFDDFKNTANTFEEIADILTQIDVKSLDYEKAKAIEILEYVWEDIKNFVNGVFIKKDVNDIFFFEQSLKATLQQLKLGLGIIHNDDNMEFF